MTKPEPISRQEAAQEVMAGLEKLAKDHPDQPIAQATTALAKAIFEPWMDWIIAQPDGDVMIHAAIGVISSLLAELVMNMAQPGKEQELTKKVVFTLAEHMVGAVDHGLKIRDSGEIITVRRHNG